MSALDILPLNAFASLEAESALIGALLLDNRAYDLVGDKLRPEHFSAGSLRDIYAEIARQLTAGKGCDMLTVFDAMDGNATLVQLAQLAQYVPSAANIRRYAEIVIERSKSRALLAVSGEIHDLAHDNSQAIDDRVEQAQAQLAKLIDDAPNDEFVSAYDGMLAHTAILEQRQAGTLTAWPTGLDDLDDYLEGGLRPGELVIVGARPSMGKELTLGAKVLLSTGVFKRMGDVMYGDKVASVDGGASVVAGVFPQGVKPVYKVTFADGRSVDAGLEHQWEVNCRHWDTARIMTTKELIDKIKLQRYKNRIFVPNHSGDFGVDADIKLHPYLLGVLIGDGGLSDHSVKITTSYLHILERIKPMLLNAELRKDQKISYRIATDRGVKNEVVEDLKKLHLYGLRSHEKFIPANYLSASKESRIELIRGLIDTDGTVEKFGAMTYCTTSKRLAEDVLSLARSLGAFASIASKMPTYTYKGEKKTGREAYTIYISADIYEEFVTIPHKKERLVKKQRTRNLNIISIDYIGDFECQCISVTHPRSLYMTDGYTVTHNTALGLTVGVRMAEKHGVGLLSMEMSHMEVNDRLTAMLGNVSLSSVKRPNRGDKLDWGRTLDGVERARSLRLYTSDQGGLNINHVRSKARNLKRLHNIDVLIVDYIGLMTGLDPKANRNTQLEEISRGLKTLAKELNICVLCLAQLNRKAEERADAMPQMSDLRDSGAIEQDADVILFIKRPIMANPDLGEQWNHYARLSIAKNRQGRCGALDLSYIGEQTRFSGWSGPAPTKSSFSTSSSRAGI